LVLASSYIAASKIQTDYRTTTDRLIKNQHRLSNAAHAGYTPQKMKLSNLLASFFVAKNTPGRNKRTIEATLQPTDITINPLILTQ